MDKNASSEAFYSGALARISNSMVALGPLSICMSWFLYGWRIAAGVACGCAIAYLNFYWLKQVVSALADRATETGKMQSTKGVVARFLVRYVLMALAAYVMFNVSAASLYGLFAGLFVPVAAIACEAAYEAYAALARGI